MIKFKEHTLSNGLSILVNEDENTPLAAFNLLYDVGARDESEDKTGFAHLFEHLMFSGSKNVPQFDEEVQLAGGTNNAFTSNDITNYYISLPSSNIETAFFVDADRMANLDVSQKAVDVQKGVVIEEFNQRYLNQPYGDAMLLFRPLLYKTHPYQWATIGKSTSHIEDATLSDVREFYNKHYNPNRAVLTISGNVEAERMFDLSQKWFGSIQNQKSFERNLPEEIEQTDYRLKVVERKVPVDAIYIGFLMCERDNKDYYTTDLISDILSRGDSSRMYQTLVRVKKVFSSVSAHITGSKDKGVFFISGKVADGVSLESAEEEVFSLLADLNSVNNEELEKVKNKSISTQKFGEVSIVNKAMNLAQFKLNGNPEDINRQNEFYGKVNLEDIKRVSASLFKKDKASVLHYKALK